MTTPRGEHGDPILLRDVTDAWDLTDADRLSNKARTRELHPVGIFVAALHKATRSREDQPG